MVMGAIAVTTAIIRTAATAATTAILRTEVIAVTTVILRTEAIADTTVLPTEAIDPGRGHGATAMATAVSGAAGQRRMSMDTNGPDMENRRDRQRRFSTRATTKPFLDHDAI